MKVVDKTIFGAWTESIKEMLRCDNVVPTDKSDDTFESLNATIQVEKPLEELDKLLQFEKKRNVFYEDENRKKYWKSVLDRLIKFPRTKVNQEEYVINKLNGNPYNRHAYVSLWAPSEDTNQTYPLCIIGLYFLVRNDSLYMTAIIRSNDSWGQALNDMYELVMIQKRIAEKLQMKVGTYTHIAFSYHMYVKNKVDAQLFISELGSND